MKHIFKPGDKAAVTIIGAIIGGPDGDGDYRIRYGNTERFFHGDFLAPLPPCMSPEAEAVLDYIKSGISDYVQWHNILEAYRAILPQPDPVDELLAAIQECAHPASPRLATAVQAVLEARK